MLRSILAENMQGKSHLNPFATPYVPLSKLSAGAGDEDAEKIVRPSENEAVENSIEHQLPDDFSLVYEVKSFGKLNLSRQSSSKSGHHNNSDDTFQDDLYEWDASNAILDSLSSMFPDISVEYLAELLAANQGDFNDTIDVLQQFEYEGTGTEHPIDIAEGSNSSILASQKASSSGTSDSVFDQEPDLPTWT